MDGRTVGFIGLGTMGGPMARNVLKGGYDVIGYDLSPAAVAALVAAGGRAAASPRAVAEAAPVVVTMLPDGPDVEAAVLGTDGVLGGLRAGSILVDMSTIDPEVTRRIGAKVAAQGACMVDAPVGKTSDHAVAGTLTLMVGGEPADVEAVRGVLDCMGSDFFYCGPLGAGETMKLINNMLAATVAGASIEALTLGVRAGLEIELMLSLMRTTMAWNNALAIALPSKALVGDYSLGFMTRLAHKDVRHAVGMAGRLGVLTPTCSAALGGLADALERGYGAEDASGSVLRLREAQAGVRVRLARR
jgi:3-hydroxyisobutyrate dehydrogenase-like beta-hydroxyacid dehydrogenase